MQVRKVKKLPRLITLPKGLKLDEYRALQAGGLVEVNGALAQYLVAHEYVEVVEKIQEDAAFLNSAPIERDPVEGRNE